VTLCVVAAVGSSSFIVVVFRTSGGDPADYRFIARGANGEPVRWNPCGPIRYVVNDAEAPAGSIGTVHEAVARVSAATGIEFLASGVTDDVPMRGRDPIEFAGARARWAPVLIAWVDPDETDIEFESGDDTAVAVAAPFAPPGEDVFVTGLIAVNTEVGAGPGFATPNAAGPTLLHELGHLVGLGHVRAPGEIMQSSGGGMTDFGLGDLEGLRRLGREAGCLQTPSADGRAAPGTGLLSESRLRA
jgi:hypothetical protein